MINANIKKTITLIAFMILVVASLFFTASLIATNDSKIFVFTPCILLLISTATLLWTLIAPTKKFLFFFGINIFFWGVLSLFTCAKNLPLKLQQIWPSAIIFCGISLIPLSIYGSKKIIAKYMIPAFVLILFGSVALAFSLGIIKQSFSNIFGRWWQVFVLLCVFAVLCVYLYGQKKKRNRLLMSDEPDSFTDTNDLGDKD